MHQEEKRAGEGTLRPRRVKAQEREHTFEPMLIDAGAARRGVHVRLLAAMGAAMLAMLCGAFLLFGGVDRFSLVSALSTALASISAAVALILSARREEHMHRLAHELQRQPLLEEPREPLATDGSI